jgi:hypothetical protein
MAVGFPTKVTYANGDVLSASDVNDTNGTINLINPSAKGDLFVGSAANTYTKLSVGANNNVIVADSTAATGLKYQGAWQTYTPSTGNMTVGNGTLTGRYRQVGKQIDCFVQFTLGSTSAIATTPFFSLPVTAAQDRWSITGRLTDSGVKDYPSFSIVNTANVFINATGAGGTFADASTATATAPFTWGTNDYFTFNFSYEAA